MIETRRVRLAFVVLTWNSAKYIERCIASIMEMSRFDICLDIIDNGSTDKTVEILDRCASLYDGKMNVVKIGKNLGTTVSRNIALRSIGLDVDYVCILDSDTEVNESAFSTMVAAIEDNPEIGLIGPRMKTSKGEVQLSGRNLPTVTIKAKKAAPFSSISECAARMEVPTTPIHDGLQDVGYLLSACWLMPRRVIDEVGLLDEKIFYAPEDVDYCIRVRNAGYRVVFCNRAEIIHEYQRISKKKLLSRSNFEHVKGLVYYFAKHRYALDADKAVKENR